MQYNVNDLDGLNAWSDFIEQFVSFTGNNTLIDDIAYNSLTSITVGQYLALLNRVEDSLELFDWSQLKPAVATIEQSLQDAGLSQIEIDAVVDMLTELSNGNLSVLNDAFNVVRMELAQYNSSDILFDVLDLTHGGPSAENDFIIGTTGDDDIDLGEGDDQFFAGKDDVGDDRIAGEGGNDLIGVGDGNDTVSGGDGSDTIFGGSGNDNLSGDAGSDTIWGGDGQDSIMGGDGNDVLGGGNLADIIFGGLGVDIVYAGRDDSSDTVDGGAGDDTLFGGGGADTLIGGSGNDQMYGGGGNDTFIFEDNHGDDSIGGFESLGDNILDLSALSGLTSFDDLSVTQSGANTVIDTGQGTITLFNTTASNFTAEDVLL
jgi:Ca2+-binding RTX toxin-like protein